MHNPHKLLVVEDDRIIRNFLTALLTSNGYTVLHAATGSEAVSLAVSHMPDLLLLDLGLPDLDGMEVLRALREWTDLPVIVVSARQDENEKVEALDAGANDYVTKPFGNSELLARIRTALRQYPGRNHSSPPSRSVFELGGLRLDYARRKVFVDDKPIHFTPIEYRILVLLSRNSGKVLTHDYIIREIWGPFASDSQVLRVNMANIRRKLETDPGDPRYILTEVGVGYRMVDTLE